MNNSQKYAVIAAATIISLMVLLHAPWSGYKTTDSYPTTPTKEQVEKGRSEGFVPTVIYKPYDLEIKEWTSYEPAAKWFGSPWNILGGVFFVSLITGLWCVLFKSNRSPPSD